MPKNNLDQENLAQNFGQKARATYLLRWIKKNVQKFILTTK